MNIPFLVLYVYPYECYFEYIKFRKTPNSIFDFYLTFIGEEIYLKTTVFERGILSATWKSKPFPPTLSTRWDPADATIIIPLVHDYDIEYISIKVRIQSSFKCSY